MRTVVFLSATLFVAACGRDDPAEPVPPPAASAQVPADTTEPEPDATAILAPTQGNQTAGELLFAPMAAGVLRLSGSISGLQPGSEHGIHIHENGDCTAPDASSAGEHFNPTGQPHGAPESDQHHAGDLSNVQADDRGMATVDMMVSGLTLRDGAANDIVGKAVVVHEKPDDYKSQPAGDSGGRLACGVVQ